MHRYGLLILHHALLFLHLLLQHGSLFLFEFGHAFVDELAHEVLLTRLLLPYQLHHLSVLLVIVHKIILNCHFSVVILLLMQQLRIVATFHSSLLKAIGATACFVAAVHHRELRQQLCFWPPEASFTIILTEEVILAKPFAQALLLL